MQGFWSSQLRAVPRQAIPPPGFGWQVSAAVQAVYDTLKALREGVAPRDLKNIASPELMRRVTRADDYQQWTKDFLGGA